jgi:hypothetical protein
MGSQVLDNEHNKLEELFEITKGDVTPELEDRFNDLMLYYTKKLYNEIMGHIAGSVNHFIVKNGVKPKITVSSDLDVSRIRIVVEAEFTPDEIDRIRKVFYKKVMDSESITRLRLRSLFKLIRKEILNISGGKYALHNHLRSGSRKSSDEAAGARR